MNICSMCNAPSTRYLTLILVDDVSPNNVNNRVEITGHYCDSCLTKRIQSYGESTEATKEKEAKGIDAAEWNARVIREARERAKKDQEILPRNVEEWAKAMLEVGRPLGEDLTPKEEDSQKWAKEYITAPVVEDDKKTMTVYGQKAADKMQEKEMSPEEKALRQKAWDEFKNKKGKKAKTE